MTLRLGPSGQVVEAIEISNDSLDVFLQDQTTSLVLQYFYRILSAHIVTSDTPANSRTIPLSGSISPGDLLQAQDSDTHRILGYVQSFAGGVATLDRPTDQARVVGSVVNVISYDMNVNGASSPVTYMVNLPSGSERQHDLTTIVVAMLCATQPDDSKFGDLAELTKGLFFRAVVSDGAGYSNLFCAKTNGEIKHAMHVFEYTDKGGGGAYSMYARAQLGGQGGYGAVVRLTDALRLEMVVQDDLSGLSRLQMLVRGHVVSP